MQDYALDVREISPSTHVVRTYSKDWKLVFWSSLVDHSKYINPSSKPSGICRLCSEQSAIPISKELPSSITTQLDATHIEPASSERELSICDALAQVGRE
jgi:hypothetical protein